MSSSFGREVVVAARPGFLVAVSIGLATAAAVAAAGHFAIDGEFGPLAGVTATITTGAILLGALVGLATAFDSTNWLRGGAAGALAAALGYLCSAAAVGAATFYMDPAAAGPDLVEIYWGYVPFGIAACVAGWGTGLVGGLGNQWAAARAEPASPPSTLSAAGAAPAQP